MSIDSIGKWIFGAVCFAMGVLVAWGYNVGKSENAQTIAIAVFVGIFVGLVVGYLAVYKLTGHALSFFKNEDEGNDPDWWKKGGPSPY